MVVRPVASASDLERFIAFPYALHSGDPMWVPVLRTEVRKLLSKKKNPFLQRNDADYFLAIRKVVGRRERHLRPSRPPFRPAALPTFRHNGEKWEVLGRIAAIHNRAHNEMHGDTVGFFGFFECVEDDAVAQALFDAAGEWLRDRNLTVMRGPTSFSTNDECGLLVDGFNTPPTIMTPHNPSYYVDLVERAGFTKAMDLYQYQSVNPQIPEALIDRVKLVLEHKKITLRTLDMKHFDEELERIKQLYNNAWESNWGFVPMSEAEIDHLAAQLKTIVVPELVIFVEHEGKPIGFAVVLPDYNVAMKNNPSGRFFPGILKILWASRKITRVRILLLGLLKQYRGIGADVVMYHWIWETGYRLGYRWAEAGWILEDNLRMNNAIQRLGFEPYRTLRFYDRPL